MHSARVSEPAANHRRSLKNPPKTADEYLDTLFKQGLTQTVGLLREWKVGRFDGRGFDSCFGTELAPGSKRG